MKLTIVTACSNLWQPLNALTFPNKEAYARRWGHPSENYLHPDGVEVAWDRVRVWIEALRKVEPGEWMWFLGVDTLIMNHATDWRSLAPFDGDLVIGLDVNGINSDSFFMRHCPESFSFLEKVLKLRGLLGVEQDAMKVLIAAEIIKADIRPQRQFNAYLYKLYPEHPDDKGGTYQDGDFVLHFPGLNLEKKINFVRKYLLRVNHPPAA